MVYKVIAKTIANRVKSILSGFIFPEKYTFLNIWHIHEPIAIAQEALHTVKTQNKPLALFKVDLSKAYDQVNWMLNRLIIVQIGFSSNLVNWILATI